MDEESSLAIRSFLHACPQKMLYIAKICHAPQQDGERQHMVLKIKSHFHDICKLHEFHTLKPLSVSKMMFTAQEKVFKHLYLKSCFIQFFIVIYCTSRATIFKVYLQLAIECFVLDILMEVSIHAKEIVVGAYYVNCLVIIAGKSLSWVSSYNVYTSFNFLMKFIEIDSLNI